LGPRLIFLAFPLFALFLGYGWLNFYLFQLFHVACLIVSNAPLDTFQKILDALLPLKATGGSHGSNLPPSGCLFDDELMNLSCP